jgi:hypothetical protein
MSVSCADRVDVEVAGVDILSRHCSDMGCKVSRPGGVFNALSKLPLEILKRLFALVRPLAGTNGSLAASPF